jgi:NADH-quinone oxidoreductase subunit N
MMVMISSNDLIVFYMGLELQSLALYVLATFNRNNLKSSEAGLKYFVLSALSSGLLLYGCSLIYGFSGSTNFEIIASQLDSNEYALTFGIVFILVGLAFKISAVPFHMWAPDVYEGSPTTVTLFFTMVPKIAALTVFIRFLYVPFLELIDQWQMILVFLSIASMLFGAIAAIGQKNIKRLIAYSSIGHIGYTLAGVASASNDGIQSSVIYLTIYIVMNLGLFSCLLMLRRNDNYYESIDDLSGLSKNHPILSFSLLVILFSLAGIPPLAGFFAKFYIFKAVIEQSMYFLAIVGLLSTVIAAFYYLRIIKIIYFDPEKEKYDQDHSPWLKFSLILSTLLILFYFISPSQIVEVVSRINFI